MRWQRAVPRLPIVAVTDLLSSLVRSKPATSTLAPARRGTDPRRLKLGVGGRRKAAAVRCGRDWREPMSKGQQLGGGAGAECHWMSAVVTRSVSSEVSAGCLKKPPAPWLVRKWTCLGPRLAERPTTARKPNRSWKRAVPSGPSSLELEPRCVPASRSACCSAWRVFQRRPRRPSPAVKSRRRPRRQHEPKCPRLPRHRPPCPREPT